MAHIAKITNCCNINEIKKINLEIEEEYGKGRDETYITTKDGEKICYTVCNKAEAMLFTGTGSIFIGMISIGPGELNGFFLGVAVFMLAGVIF